MSKFGEAIRALLDDSNLFSRREWEYILSVKNEVLEDWINDRAIPRPDQLFMLVMGVDRSSGVPKEVLEYFNSIADIPALEASPHGNSMLPTVRRYMMRPTFRPLLDDEKEQTNESQEG